MISPLERRTHDREYEDSASEKVKKNDMRSLFRRTSAVLFRTSLGPKSRDDGEYKTVAAWLYRRDVILQ